MEIWDLLDSEGNKTGKTMEKGINIPEGYYHLGVDVWIINSENKILIQKRSSQKKLSPNVWAMTGGSVIKGETSIQTIEREALEELGVKLNIENLKLVNHYRTGNVWLDVYLLKQDINIDDVIMQKEEVSEVKWATYEEIEQIYQNGDFIEDRWEYIRNIILNNL